MALLMAAFSAIALMATHLLSSRPTATIDCLCELWLALVNTATQEGELMGDHHVTPRNLDSTLKPPNPRTLDSHSCRPRVSAAPLLPYTVTGTRLVTHHIHGESFANIF